MADKIERKTGEESPVEYAGNRIQRVEQRIGRESASAAYRGGKRLAVKTYEKVKAQKQKQERSHDNPVGRGKSKRWHIYPGRADNGKERANRSHKKH